MWGGGDCPPILELCLDHSFCDFLLQYVLLSIFIPDISLASGSYCQALLDYLIDRLDKDSYLVKIKVRSTITLNLVLR